MSNTSLGLKPMQFYSMANIKCKAKFETKSVITSPAKKKQKCDINVERQDVVEANDEESLPRKSKTEHLQDEGMSEYEKMIQKNIEEKMAFLASLNVDVLKQDLHSLASDKKSTKPKVLRDKPPLPLRQKSLRLQKIPPVFYGKIYSDLPVRQSLRIQKIPASETDVLSVSTKVNRNKERQKPHRTLTFPEVFNVEDDLNFSNLFCDSLQSLNNEHFELKSVPYDRWEKHFKNMKINSSLVAKVVPRRIPALSVHPTTSKTLVCAGSNHGHLGFWDVESNLGDDGVFLYQPHSAPVTCVAFNMNKPCQIISTSYDGTVRCGNFEKGVFDEIYYTDENYNIGVTSFDFLSSDSILLSQTDGRVCVVDTRTPNQELEISHQTHPLTIKSLSVHPVKKDYFIASGRNGIVSLWDLRKLEKLPLAELAHPRIVHSAYFSALSGNFILTSSTDDKIRIFDSSHLNKNITLKTTIRHNNQTGRWLNPFRPVWLPNNEDAFVVGSMSFPRRIEVFNTTGALVHMFTGEDLGAISCINVLHPSKQILAGGSSGGKVYVFKDES